MFWLTGRVHVALGSLRKLKRIFYSGGEGGGESFENLGGKWAVGERFDVEAWRDGRE